MPTILRSGSFRFFFYSNEALPREPAHVHVERGDMEAKFWLRPEVHLGCMRSTGLSLDQTLEKAWDEFFG